MSDVASLPAVHSSSTGMTVGAMNEPPSTSELISADLAKEMASVDLAIKELEAATAEATLNAEAQTRQLRSFWPNLEAATGLIKHGYLFKSKSLAGFAWDRRYFELSYWHDDGDAPTAMLHYWRDSTRSPPGSAIRIVLGPTVRLFSRPAVLRNDIWPFQLDLPPGCHAKGYDQIILSGRSREETLEWAMALESAGVTANAFDAVDYDYGGSSSCYSGSLCCIGNKGFLAGK